MPTETFEPRVLPADPVATLEAYRGLGGGTGLERALSLGPDATIAEVERALLRGRGGAGFPTGQKWSSVVQAAGDDDVYVVCNGAEGEPGTYKDRVLLARNPFAVVEGCLIALHAVRGAAAFIGVKQRFAEEIGRLVEARDALVADGWTRARDVHIVAGPDEYLFGEESAMLEVIERKLPMPRILPPYMQGLFATMQHPNPTVVNNVETLSHVSGILARGADWFREVGTHEAPGSMVFTVTGDVARAGVWELPLGTPLRHLVEDLAGAQDPLAIYSGTSNAVISPALLDLPLDFDSFREAGTGLGSGGFMVYDRSRDPVQVVAALARFLAVESCGQCLACKLGTGAMYESLDRLVAGTGTAGDVEEIRRRCATVTDGNRCYLPVGAALTIGSTLDAFPEAFAERIGSPSVAPPVPIPKLVKLDTARGTAAVDASYHRKRADWSYADEADAADLRYAPPT